LNDIGAVWLCTPTPPKLFQVINLWPLNVEGMFYNYIMCRQSITFRNFMMNKDRKAVCSNLLRFYLIFKNIFVTLDDCGCVNEQIFGVKCSCEQFNVSFHRNSKLNPGLVSLPNGDRIFLGPKNRNYRFNIFKAVFVISS